jgi:iron complex transport system ATP-binding protein
LSTLPSTPPSATATGATRAAEIAAADVRLSVEQISYAYGAKDRDEPEFSLSATSFQARFGEIVAVLGANASGKSTLLRLLAGTLNALTGRVLLEGVDISRLDARTRAQRIAVVQQETPLLFPLRVWEYVLQGRHPYGRTLRFESELDLLIARHALDQVNAAPLADRWMDRISGGEKQRVVLARALAQQPLLLLLDEPTLHLDIGAQVELLQRLRRLAEENHQTVVIVTHELNLAAEFADQVLLLDRGKCLGVGPPAEIYRKDLLEQMYSTSLDIEAAATGQPRVTVTGLSRVRPQGRRS